MVKHTGKRPRDVGWRQGTPDWPREARVNKMAAELQAKEAAVSNFREYLRIKTVHPKPDIGGKSYVKLLLRAPFIKRPPFMIFHLDT